MTTVGLRATGLACALVAVLSVLPDAADAGEPPRRLVPFALEDQHGTAWDGKRLDGRAVVLIAAGRGGRAYTRPWGDALRALLADDGAEDGGGPLVLRVADLRALPPPLRGNFRRRFQREEPRPVLLDWNGELSRAYGFEPDRVDIAVFGRDGGMILRTAAREVERGRLAAVLAAARLAARPPPQSACALAAQR